MFYESDGRFLPGRKLLLLRALDVEMDRYAPFILSFEAVLAKFTFIPLILLGRF